MDPHSYQKYRGRNFDEVEESVANDYESGKPDAALPRDTCVLQYTRFGIECPAL
jgi:hypothetical protein